MIEKNIPIPPRIHGAGRPSKYSIGDLEIGDSVFIPRVGRVAVWYWRKKLGAEYVTRTIEQDGIRGTRVWRSA